MTEGIVFISIILYSKFGRIFQTVHGLLQTIGFIETTGLHSVIPYHSKITQFGDNSLNLSNTSFEHFSAQTTAYFTFFK